MEQYRIWKSNGYCWWLASISLKLSLSYLTLTIFHKEIAFASCGLKLNCLKVLSFTYYLMRAINDSSGKFYCSKHLSWCSAAVAWQPLQDERDKYGRAAHTANQVAEMKLIIALVKFKDKEKVLIFFPASQRKSHFWVIFPGMVIYYGKNIWLFKL